MQGIGSSECDLFTIGIVILTADGENPLQPITQECKIVYEPNLIEAVDKNAMGLPVYAGFLQRFTALVDNIADGIPI